MTPLVQLIDGALPQTQCTRCGYPDCRAYAEAIADQRAAINQCPPGGQEGVERLARLTGQAAEPLNPENGIEGPLTVAVIDESWCIGCTLCLDACPTDAIVGTHKRMHTVIEPHCTGCELCIPVCPVDCISLDNVSGERTGWAAWSSTQAQTAQARYHARTARLKRQQAEHQAAKAAQAQHKLANLADHSKITDPDALARKRAIIEAAMARARSARSSQQGGES